MVDMMKTDAPAEPLQDLRQLIKGTSLQGLGHVIPILVTFPVHAFELMLHIEHPHPGAGRDHDDRNLDQKVIPKAHKFTQPRRHQKDPQVGQMRAYTVALTCLSSGDPVHDQKQNRRSDEKQTNGITRQTVLDPGPTGRLEIFFDGQGPDIT